MNRNQSAPSSPTHPAPRGDDASSSGNSHPGGASYYRTNYPGGPFFHTRTTFHVPPRQPKPNFFDNIWKNISNSTQNIFDSGFNKKMSKSCSSCGLSLGTLSSKRRRCQCCSHNFCTECMGSSCCRRCAVFRSSIPMNRELLNTLKVRDLKWYLNSRNIPSDTYYEKRELVDLILLGYQQAARASQPPPEQQQPQQTRSGSSTPTTSSASASAYSSSATSSPVRENNEHRSTPSVESIRRPTSTINLAAEPEAAKFSRVKDMSSSLFDLTRFCLDDIQSVDEIKQLSIRQLKLLLTRNYVDFKGCVERGELVQKVVLLWNDKQTNRAKEIESEENKTDDGICKICMEHAIDCVLLECGHMLTCTACGKTLSDCPVCRQFVSRVVHVFKA